MLEHVPDSSVHSGLRGCVPHNSQTAPPFFSSVSWLATPKKWWLIYNYDLIIIIKKIKQHDQLCCCFFLFKLDTRECLDITYESSVSKNPDFHGRWRHTKYLYAQILLFNVLFGYFVFFPFFSFLFKKWILYKWNFFRLEEDSSAARCQFCCKEVNKMF